MQRYRTYGDGLIRISKKIEISKDIYALGFICQLRYDILSEYFDFENDKLLKNDKKYKVYPTQYTFAINSVKKDDEEN